MRAEWFTEDGTFIGPWWAMAAFLAGSFAIGPVAWLIATKSISWDVIALWVVFVSMMNLFRAKEFYQPVVRWVRQAMRRRA